ncbi:MAG: diacylglycerol kinase [Burkholderiales bacterium]|nr:diacylglycerol kinase [Burkholderiales bacterium]
MKNKSFHVRLRFALSGIGHALRSERSFRTQCLCAFASLLLLVWKRPSPFWWALFCLSIALVLSLELVNSSLEALADRLHPEIHPLIQAAKDCAAGAVLVASLASLGVFAAFVVSLI